KIFLAICIAVLLLITFFTSLLTQFFTPTIETHQDEQLRVPMVEKNVLENHPQKNNIQFDVMVDEELNARQQNLQVEQNSINKVEHNNAIQEQTILSDIVTIGICDEHHTVLKFWYDAAVEGFLYCKNFAFMD